uniref:F-box domain-containing protein n=1 Tax=Oryza glumipatula TaxID=40148 RepID=A0A0D9ZPY3_9ORYZ
MSLETARPGESKRRNTDAVDTPSPRAWKRRKHAAPAANLPDDIISEILLLLPARSLIRFRAVCRSWDARLSSPSFAEAYAANAAAHRMTNYKFVFFAPSPNRSTAAYSCTRRTVAVDRLFTVDRLRTDFLCLCSKPCHGLLLFSDARSRRYWVCNPSTGECRRLPQQHRGLTGSSAGLVYDHRTKERKVVHLFFKERTAERDQDQDQCIQCEVYTLQDPSRQWRPANGDVESLTGRAVKALEIEDMVTKVPPVLAAGCLHWLVYPNRGDDVSLEPGQDAILCFSVTTENLRLLNAPASVLHAVHHRRLDENFSAVPIHLAELQGSLCVVHDLRQRGSETTSSIDLWMLRDHDAGEWSLDYRIAVTPILARGVHSPRFITVLGCCGGGGTDRMKILIATSQHKIHAYDPDTGHIDLVLSVSETDIGYQEEESAAAVWFGLYEDSLVRIGGQSFGQKQVLSGLTEILLRFPIKSIAKSMLVCREWCSLIESESFVSKHTSSSSKSLKILMITNGLDGRAFFDFAPVGSWLQAGPAHVSRRIICSKPCNGLNLISTSSDDYLCNPCTGAIRCLGIRGKSPRFNPGCCTDQQSPSRRHAFSVGRNVGFGLDRSTGDHVAVEIGRVDGVLACMVKTSSAETWTACAGKPPVPLSDMPPAHVDGTLYWMSVRTRQQERVVVAFDISSRSFNIVPCEPCLNNTDSDAFLVELDGTLCLVVTNAEADEMEIWAMHRDGSWVDAYMIHLNEHPDYSVKTGQAPVVPVDVSSKDGSILLNTGRALGYYDYKTGAIHNPYYSLDQLKLPHSSLAFPILCQESIARIQDDQLPTRVVPPFSLEEESSGCRGHPQHAGGATPGGCGPSRSVLQECEDGACRNVGVVYRSCCRRVFCDSCGRRCLEHSRLLYLDHDLPASFSDMDMQIQDSSLFLGHPCVPGTDYCYYYSTERGNVVRHVFISLKDYIQSNQSWHLIECGYRIEGKVIKDTWVQRYLEL